MIVFSGIQGAGKSTFFHQRFASSHAAWQKRGVGLYFEDYEKSAVNPKTGETVSTTRRRIHRDLELPIKDEYGQFILNKVAISEMHGGI